VSCSNASQLSGISSPPITRARRTF
jgi:hypothetical protein